jgi:hypothetical protein
MSDRLYSLPTPSIALASATAKSVLALIPGSAEPLTIVHHKISLDAATLLLVELCESTQASNGTTGTDASGLIKQLTGFVAGDSTSPSGIGARHTYTSEPTVLSVLDSFWFTGPGPFPEFFPLGQETQSLVSGATKYKALVWRLTAAAACNCRVTARFKI